METITAQIRGLANELLPSVLQPPWFIHQQALCTDSLKQHLTKPEINDMLKNLFDKLTMSESVITSFANNQTLNTLNCFFCVLLLYFTLKALWKAFKVQKCRDDPSRVFGLVLWMLIVPRNSEHVEQADGPELSSFRFSDSSTFWDLCSLQLPYLEKKTSGTAILWISLLAITCFKS